LKRENDREAHLTRNHIDIVRRFLRDVAEGRDRAGKVPGALLHLAAKALRGMPSTPLLSADDVVSELMLSVWQGRWSSLDWKQPGDAAFEARLRKSLRDIAVERTEGWGFRKSLREHVAGALQDGLPKGVRDMPASLCDGDRFSRRLVAEATAFVVAERPELAKDPTALTNLLVRLHGPHLVSLSPANDDREAYDVPDTRDAFAQIEAALDVTETARDLAEALQPHEAVVLQGRLAGRGLQELADELGCAVSTAFKREKKAVEKVGVVMRRRRVGADTLSQALDLVVT
jgi:DNA-directed RNA polymerase specialized sigma24 family protein